MISTILVYNFRNLVSRPMRYTYLLYEMMEELAQLTGRYVGKLAMHHRNNQRQTPIIQRILDAFAVLAHIFD